MKKKICYVTTIPPTFESFMLESALYLNDNGWDISLISSYSEDIEEILQNKIHYYPVKMKRGISLDGIKATYQMYKIFKKEKFDVVQYSTPNAGFYASIASALAGLNCRIYHLMGFRYLGFSGLKKEIFKKIDTLACMLSTHVECVSASNYKLGLLDKVFKKDKTCIIWNGSTGGVNLKRFNYNYRNIWKEEIRNELKIEEDEFVFGFAGSVSRDKGISELIDSFENIDNCKIIIIGNKEFENDKELEKKFDLFEKKDNVIFCGRKQNIEKYYSAMDVLILPSYREGFGMVLAEAAALGTPAITTRIPGPLDVIVENETALVVEPKDVQSLTNAIDYCLNNKAIIKNMETNCVNYIVNTFDSKILCE